MQNIRESDLPGMMTCTMLELQGEVDQYRRTIEEIETWKARGASIRSRVKWQKVGDKCAKFF
jgi:hypothetical protein